MEACQSCGAMLPPDVQWCGQCYAVVGAPPAATSASVVVAPAAEQPEAAPFGGGSVMSPSRQVAATTTSRMVKTRWKKTATTFGPLGRVLCTFALVVPFVVFVLLGIFTGGLVIAAPVVWGFAIMPWGLRDTWKAGQLAAT